MLLPLCLSEADAQLRIDPTELDVRSRAAPEHPRLN
jgi:hypothetical protein